MSAVYHRLPQEKALDALKEDLRLWVHDEWDNDECDTRQLASEKIIEIWKSKSPSFILTVEHGQLTTLPQNFGRFTSLREIILLNHRLHTIPASIGKCENLETLNLSGNALDRLPPEIESLKHLQTVHLRRNSFTFETLISLPKQWIVFISGNPLKKSQQSTLLKHKTGPSFFL